MVHDDFCALDLLSIEAFGLYPAVKAKRKQAKLAKRRLASLLPLLGRKAKKAPEAGLQGWAVPLSWPSRAPSPVCFDLEGL